MCLKVCKSLLYVTYIFIVYTTEVEWRTILLLLYITYIFIVYTTRNL